MSGSLSLLPRKFAKRTAIRKSFKHENNGDSHIDCAENGPVPPIQPVAPIVVGAESAESYSHGNVIQNDAKGKDKATNDRSWKYYTDTDYARLLCLALSDYGLHVDADLRRAIGQNLGAQEFEGSSTWSGGYVPFNEVLKRFSLHYGVKSPPRSLMVGMVKALRTKATELVDVRLTLASSGGYELCRKGWTNGCVSPGLSYTKQEWDQRTVYIERVPIEYRDVPGILQFLTNLLEDKPAPSFHPWARIQGVTLPPHHQDQPGNPPICKGLCLVTFAAIEDAIFLMNQWPWTRKTSGIMDTSNGEKDRISQDVKNAIRFGFRVLSKMDWERLRTEYLTYRTEILNTINGYEDAAEEAQPALGKRRWRDGTPDLEENSEPIPSEPITSKLTPNAPYPYGCLVFVRNIHPETNKTALRTLFSSAFMFEEQTGRAQGPPTVLDYIDYSKGMDSCYLRLSTPTHTDLLVRHFERKRTVQTDGLDGKATLLESSAASDKAITVEKITGKKEEVYWERVPEKVRKQAVQKVITFLDGAVTQDVSSVAKHLRKRRKAD